MFASKAIRSRLLSAQRWSLSSRRTETSNIQNTFTKLAIIGGGQMCEAILGALKVKGVQRMSDVTVCDIHSTRLSYLKDKFGVNTSTDLNEAIKDSAVTILSVKPQNVQSLAATLKQPPPGLLLSICAGVSLEQLHNSFRAPYIVRSMPNTPAMVLEGMTVWIASKDTPDAFKEQARTLLNALGDQIEVFEEHYIDMATAVSGSGPAYVFLTMEAMVDAAVHMGFQRDVATKLVTATIKGTAAYAQVSGEHASRLRNNVTSPGGTTASALYELEKGSFRTIIADAVWAAYRRALELGGKNSNVGPGRSSNNHNQHH